MLTFAIFLLFIVLIWLFLTVTDVEQEYDATVVGRAASETADLTQQSQSRVRSLFQILTTTTLKGKCRS